MEIENSRYANGRVLAVDDEPVARQQLAFQLSALGLRASVAGSAGEAQEILSQEGSDAFECLITDCWMPRQTGLDLLLWLRKHDPTLASIVVSNAADKEVITQTLRGGASDFLEKPVFRGELQVALQRAIESTARRRRHAATNSAVREAGLVQRRMNNLGVAGNFPAALAICYHPCHDAGGDSVAFFTLAPGRILAVVADVSGHNLKSAFISAYFQGMLRGMVEQNVPIGVILDSFNRFLIREWSAASGAVDDSAGEITSLSVCAASIDLRAGSVDLLNSGFPLPSRIDRRGWPQRCGETGGNPLGWSDPNLISALSLAVDGSERLIIWTDGLEEYAHQLQVSEWSLAFRILQTKQKRQSTAWLAGAPDDVLMVLIGLDEDGREQTQDPFPILTGDYEKHQSGSIDELQDGWRRSLTFAFPDLAPDCVSDILLCTREAVMNGLLHGCREASGRCRLAIVFDAGLAQNGGLAQNSGLAQSGAGRLRVDVMDSGDGHRFDWQKQTAGEFEPAHRGLLLMHLIAERFEEESSGAVVRMFFSLEHTSTEVVKSYET